MSGLTPEEEARVLANPKVRRAMERLAKMGPITVSRNPDGSPVITINLNDRKRPPR